MQTQEGQKQNTAQLYSQIKAGVSGRGSWSLSWYTATQQHVCLQASLSIRSGARKIDLFSTWRLPSIWCKRCKGRHSGIKQASCLSSPQRATLDFSSQVAFHPNIRLAHALQGFELVSPQHTHSLRIYGIRFIPLILRSRSLPACMWNVNVHNVYNHPLPRIYAYTILMFKD